MSARAFSVYDILKRNSVLFPDEIAVVDGTDSMTFSHFLAHVESLSAGIERLFEGSAGAIAVLSMNSLEYLAIYGAAAALGRVLVPLNWRLSTDELSYIVKDSGAVLLFFDSSQKDQAFALEAGSGNNIRLVFMDKHSERSDISPEASGYTSYSSLVENLGSSVRDFKPVIPESEDIFTLIYTAAVSGRPRGAALSHGNIISSNLQTALTMNISRKDIYLNMLPMFHITGMNLSLVTMHMGGRNVIMEKFNVKEALDNIRRFGVTVMGSFPPILNTITDELEKTGDYDISSLRSVIGIDSPDNIARFREKTSSSFWILYGQSETSGFVTLSDTAECPGSAGCQGCISCMAIVDENDIALPPGESGEIAVRGPLVFQGYHINGESRVNAASRFDTSSIRNGWHHTGDIGRVNSEGYLWFEGRKPEKELIKPGGENVYPAEVESVVMRHPEILDCCVIGVPDPKFGEGVKAVCVRSKGSELSAAGLIEFVGARIARYKKPGYVEFVDAIPKKGDGSTDRKKVKELHGS